MVLTKCKEKSYINYRYNLSLRTITRTNSRKLIRIFLPDIRSGRKGSQFLKNALFQGCQSRPFLKFSAPASASDKFRLLLLLLRLCLRLRIRLLLGLVLLLLLKNQNRIKVKITLESHINKIITVRVGVGVETD